MTIDTNLDGPYNNFSCCVLGIRNNLIQEDRDAAAALDQAILEAAEHVANDPADAGVVFGKILDCPA